MRFARKTREQYVLSEAKDGKATGWRANYRDGRWQESAAKTPAAKRKTSAAKTRKKKAPARKRATTTAGR